jgi:hypothetical protein
MPEIPSESLTKNEVFALSFLYGCIILNSLTVSDHSGGRSPLNS